MDFIVIRTSGSYEKCPCPNAYPVHITLIERYKNPYKEEVKEVDRWVITLKELSDLINFVEQIDEDVIIVKTRWHTQYDGYDYILEIFDD